MIPEQLAREVEALRHEGLNIELREAEGWANILIHQHPVPKGYSKNVIELLVKAPLSYPNGKPDMFWTDKDLVLKNGQVPKSAESIERALEKEWRRFSWHPQNWNPAYDNLKTYIEFVNTRLAKEV